MNKCFIAACAAACCVSAADAASLADLEREVRASQQAGTQMQREITQLTSELQQANGQIEEAQYRINELQKTQLDLYRQIDELRGQLASGCSRSGESGAKAAAVSDGSERASSIKKSAAVSKNGDKDAYKKALDLVMNDKNYKGSVAAFKKFLADYPDSSLIDNAHFWLADSNSKLGNAQEAKMHFLQVVKNPEATKRSEALFKLGMIAKSEGNGDSAKKFFALVVRDYPESATAKLAEKEIAKLK